MRVLIQRVKHASVTVADEIKGKIGRGLLVFAGFEEGDTEEDMKWIAGKIIRLRIFPDKEGVMNISLQDIEGEILIVSQFTLHAQVKKGNRPSYIRSSPPELAKKQYADFVRLMENEYLGRISTGEFGADMKVELLNDGPVTIWIDSKNRE